MSRQQELIRPRNGHTLVVGIVARISGGPNQKELSLDDQIDHAKQVVAEMYDGPVEYRVISTTGKGERLDRPELTEVEAMLRSRELDALIAEDIGRIVRGTEASWLCGVAVDHGTRVIAPNDCIDTGEDTWEEDVISACRDHVGHNAHTSKRLKHKLMNRFKKFGGATPREIFGYKKPPGAKTYDEWQKDPDATSIYRFCFRMLLEHGNCSAVADWLNSKGIPTGKYARRKTWDGKMVRRLIGNMLLKGIVGRGFKRTVKHHETGRRVAVPNPAGPSLREVPHLAHVDSELWDDVNRKLKEANKGFGRKPVGGVDPRCGVPKKRTRFPGQHAQCDFCGRIYVWGANGTVENLMCSGSREWRCWNSIGVNGSLATNAVVTALAAELERLDGFDAQFRGMVAEAAQRGGANSDRRSAELRRAESVVANQRANILDAITSYGPKPMFTEKLAELDAEEQRTARERRELDKLRGRPLILPGSVADLRGMFQEKFQVLAANSLEFGALLQQVVPNFRVHLVRLCDGGHLLPRAQVSLSLAGLVPDTRHVPEMSSLLTRSVTLDLFEAPQRERIRPEAARLAAEGVPQREIARRLAEPATQAAVSQALALDRRMRELGLDTPYVLVTEPPTDYQKLRRHKNPKYRFEPLPDHHRPNM